MTLQKMRKKIDKINERLVCLLGKRLTVAKKIAKIKKEEGLPVLDKSREENQAEVLKKLADEYHVDPDFVEALFEDLVAHTRDEMEQEMKAL